MQNEMTVEASGSLSYYAGALRVARADFARIENNAADYGAMHAEAMEAARDELFVAEEDFRCEFQACQALQELGAMEAAPVAVAMDAPAKVEAAKVEAAKVEAAKVEAAKVEAAKVEAAKASRVKCPHYRAIRRAFAIAKDRGLDTTKAGKARARHAMEDVVGQCVESRAEYNGADWMKFGDKIKAGAVRW
jgi:hypothetical protein